MKKEKISNIISNIDSKYIDEATTYKSNEKAVHRNRWMKLGTIAACFALIAMVGFPFIKNLFVTHDKVLEPIILIKYDDSIYEIIEDNPQLLKRYGLNTNISVAEIGEHIVYLQKEDYESEHSDYISVQDRTEFELLEYAPAPYQAVRIFRNGEKYFYALFCNYVVPYDECMPIRSAFEVNGVFESGDIASITPIQSKNTFKATGKAITDSDMISEFYNEIISLEAYSQEEHHDLVFADELAKAEGTGGDIGTVVYTGFADDHHNILIETKSGIKFNIDYYPSYGWIYTSETMSFYKMTASISKWFSDNL